MSKLIYHTKESYSGGVSPFDKTIHKICKDQNILLTCPYIGIKYIEKILLKSRTWKIISDVEEWVKSSYGDSRKQIINFILENRNKIHHFPNLHSKVIITGNKGFIGSANFTKMGITERIEMAVLIQDSFQVLELKSWFENLWDSSDEVDDNELLKFFKKIEQSKITTLDIHKTLNSKVPKLKSRLLYKKINPINKKQIIRFDSLNIIQKIELIKYSKEYKYVERILNKKQSNETEARMILHRNLGKLKKAHIEKIFDIIDEPYTYEDDKSAWFKRLIKSNSGRFLSESEDKINKWFNYLTNNDISVFIRIDNLLYDESLRIKNASVGLITLIFYLLDNSRHSIWWDVQHAGLKIFYPELDEFNKDGRIYIKFNKLSKEFAKEYDFQNTALDWVFSNAEKVIKKYYTN